MTHDAVTIALILVAICFAYAALVKWQESYRLAPPAEDDDGVQCEACSKVIRTGMGYSTTTDGCTLCEEHAPTYQDCVDYWNDAISSAPDLSLTEEEQEWKAESDKACAEHIAAGGSADDKPLWVMT